MRFLYSILFVAAFGFLFTSCRTQKPFENYLEDLNDTTRKRNLDLKEPIIQKNDLLSIQVYSAATQPGVDERYNLPNNQTGAQGQQQGFLVNTLGEIEYPRVGVIKAEGLTKAQLANVIKNKLEGQLTNPSVIIRFLNFRVTVLGEVGNPGVLSIPTERLTILEAIGMAGDITEYGKKKEVKILRQNNEQLQTGIVDVSSQKMFESPYFQLQQNDVVIVEQTNRKIKETEQQRITQQLGFALSIITSIALLYNIFR